MGPECHPQFSPGQLGLARVPTEPWPGWVQGGVLASTPHQLLLLPPPCTAGPEVGFVRVRTRMGGPWVDSGRTSSPGWRPSLGTQDRGWAELMWLS